MELVWSGYEPIRRTLDAVWIDGVVDDCHTWIDPISHPKDSCRLDTARFVKFFIKVYRIFYEFVCVTQKNLRWIF